MSLLELAGAPADVIQSVEQKASPNPDEVVCYVWEENWATVEFFSNLRAQWVIVAGLSGGVRIGLDNARVEATMRMEMIPPKERKALLADLRIMESAVIEYDSQKKH